jgi:hypothetical protein
MDTPKGISQIQNIVDELTKRNSLANLTLGRKEEINDNLDYRQDRS